MKEFIGKMKEDKRILILISIVLVILLVGLTYAWLVFRDYGTQSIRLKGGSLDLVLDETSSNGINIVRAIPMSDNQGLDSNYTANLYTFRVINNSSVNVKYQLYLDDALETGDIAIPDSNIKYSITRNSSADSPILLSTVNRKIDDVIIDAGDTYTYTLRLWVDSETPANIADGVFKSKIRLTGTQTEESASSVYQLSGTLVDNNGDPIQNANVAVFSNPVYTTTDSEGKFTINGLEYGNHTMYYTPSGVSITGLSKNQIEALSGYGKASISTTSLSSTVSLSNGSSITNASITSGTINASAVSYDDTYNMGCSDVACALDKLYEIIN